MKINHKLREFALLPNVKDSENQNSKDDVLIALHRASAWIALFALVVSTSISFFTWKIGSVANSIAKETLKSTVSSSDESNDIAFQRSSLERSILLSSVVSNLAVLNDTQSIEYISGLIAIEKDEKTLNIYVDIKRRHEDQIKVRDEQRQTAERQSAQANIGQAIDENGELVSVDLSNEASDSKEAELRSLTILYAKNSVSGDKNLGKEAERNLERAKSEPVIDPNSFDPAGNRTLPANMSEVQVTEYLEKYENLIQKIDINSFDPYQLIRMGALHNGYGDGAGLNTYPELSRFEPNILTFATILDIFEVEQGCEVFVDSFYRSPAYNGAIGKGNNTSKHLVAGAVEFSCTSETAGSSTNYDWLQTLEKIREGDADSNLHIQSIRTREGNVRVELTRDFVGDP